MALSYGIAAQRAPGTVWSVVFLFHSMPAAISVQVQTMEELPMVHGSNISAAIPLSSAASSAAATPCAPFNDETCLQHLYWGGGYSCESATEWCHSWGKDMQRCCSLACGTAYLTETACNQMVSAGTCAYPHSGSTGCEEAATPSPTNPPTPAAPQGDYQAAPQGGYGGYGGYGGFPVGPTATPSPTNPATPAAPAGDYQAATQGGYGGYGGFPAGSTTPSPTNPPTPAPPSGGYGAYGGFPVDPLATVFGAGAAPVSATGDPHLRNVHGEEFDLMEPGKHVLIQIPRKPMMYTLLRVDAEVQTLGGQCADMYFQELNITGAWADVERSGGLHYYAQSANDKPSHWMHFGSVRLKVAHGRTKEGTRYLNFYVRDLARAGFSIGGLLGDDDHTEAAMPPEGCVHRLAL